MKRLKQSILPFAPLRERIIGRVCPATVADVDTDVGDDTLKQTFEMKKVPNMEGNSSEVFCNGMIAKKNLTDTNVQNGIMFTCKYFKTSEVEKCGYKYSIVRSTSSMHSIFSINCTGGSETVR